jgi:hypothetical protein
VVVPTGTASPWREIDVSTPENTVCYVRDGHVTGSADLLAEALRMDGVTRSTYPAILLAEDAQLEPGWYGYVDEADVETLCNASGETSDGEMVDEPRPCVYTLINLEDA